MNSDLRVIIESYHRSKKLQLITQFFEEFYGEKYSLMSYTYMANGKRFIYEHVAWFH